MGVLCLLSLSLSLALEIELEIEKDELSWVGFNCTVVEQGVRLFQFIETWVFVWAKSKWVGGG